jgi:hypothetical protein
MSWKLSNGSELIDIESPFEIDNAIRQLDERFKNEPQLIELISPNGGTLVIGVGGKNSYLNYVEPDGWPAYSSVGSIQKEGLLTFTMNEYHTEIPARYGISFNEALTAAIEFFKTMKMPECIIWEEN